MALVDTKTYLDRRADAVDSTAPTGGTHKVGDIVWNETPTPGGYIGWVCTTAGTPGTWKQFGAIAL